MKLHRLSAVFPEFSILDKVVERSMLFTELEILGLELDRPRVVLGKSLAKILHLGNRVHIDLIEPNLCILLHRREPKATHERFVVSEGLQGFLERFKAQSPSEQRSVEQGVIFPEPRHLMLLHH